MTPERWQRVRDIAYAVLDAEPHEREALLRRLCGEDVGLNRDVEAMMTDAVSDGSILAAPAWEVMGLAAGSADTAKHPGLSGDRIPGTIGNYRIVRVVGEGGMGIVYEAEQDEPHRTVALKVIRPGFPKSEMLRRFRQEFQALGRLQHPGIAQIYEAGTADTGFGPQPYFAMEFIRGESLTDYVRSHGLRVSERLDLMARICDAVEHAHQRGLIHRDLKPANILVDEAGQPKILDFGVARVTDSDVRKTQQTDVGQLIGTLAYMSPEQVLADPLELDTRSDVYSLGVILYELLADRLPYTVGSWLPEAVRTIQQEDPQRLSSVSRAYRGDLETIAAKALEKDKTRRYGSAAALVADIRRYLENEPISARPASASYQLRKFARRHKAVVGGAVAVFMVLTAGIVTTTREALRARRAERAALSAEATTVAINDFLRDDVLGQASVFRQSGPGVKPDPDLRVRTALERAAASLGERFQSRPLIEAAVRQTIGDSYQGLGLYPEALAQLDRSLSLRQAGLGPDHPDTLTTMHLKGHVLSLQAKYTDAEHLFTAALAARRRVLGDDHADTLLTMNSLGVLYANRGEYNRAEPLLVKYLEAIRSLRGEDSREAAAAMNDLAFLYKSDGKYSAAEPLYKRALEIREHALGPENPETLATMNDFAHLYRLQARYKDAEPLYVRSLERKRRVFGSEHSETAIGAGNLGNLYSNMGEYAKAESLLIESMEARLRIWGEDHPDTATGINNLAAFYSAVNRKGDAERLYERALGIRRRTLGTEHSLTMQSVANLAIAYRVAGKYAQARALLTQSLAIMRRVHGEQHLDTLYQVRSLAGVCRLQQDFAAAEPLAVTALAGYRRALGDDHPETLIAEEELAALRLAQGRPDEAYRHASRTLAVRQRTAPPNNAVLLRMKVFVGRVQLRRKQYVEAEPLFREAREAYLKTTTDRWRAALAEALLGPALAGQGKFAEAEQLVVSGYRQLTEYTALIPADSLFFLDEARQAVTAVYRAQGKQVPLNVQLRPR